MNDYELLDFGNGRRLERFGSLVVDRPCPAALDFRKNDPGLWSQARFRFVPHARRGEGERGTWMPKTPESWTIRFGRLCLELRGTPFGHLGIFPEQRTNWTNITKRLEQTLTEERRTLRVLNLFAYTGGSSIAAALAGTEIAGAEIEVVHVDSSRSVVEWAKRNGEYSGVGRGIRFIVDDARKFVAREARRGNHYDAVILDPPSYGHGVRGEAWKILEHLPELLKGIVSLLSAHPASEPPTLFLLTAHSPELNSAGLRAMLRESGLVTDSGFEDFSMSLVDVSGRMLPMGCGVELMKRE